MSLYRRTQIPAQAPSAPPRLQARSHGEQRKGAPSLATLKLLFGETAASDQAAESGCALMAAQASHLRCGAAKKATAPAQSWCGLEQALNRKMARRLGTAGRVTP